MAAEPWFGAGLRFSCRGCGGCCSGAPGAVWVEAEDIDRLARQLDMSADHLERAYVRRRGLRGRLYEWGQRRDRGIVA